MGSSLASASDGLVIEHVPSLRNQNPDTDGLPHRASNASCTRGIRSLQLTHADQRMTPCFPLQPGGHRIGARERAVPHRNQIESPHQRSSARSAVNSVFLLWAGVIEPARASALSHIGIRSELNLRVRPRDQRLNSVFPLAYRLSPIAYSLKPIAHRLPPPAYPYPPNSPISQTSPPAIPRRA